MKICNWTVRRINVVLLSALIFLTNSIFFWHTAVYAFEGYGVTTYRLSELSGDEAKVVFELIEKAGIRWVRLGFRWNEIEPQEGAYQFDKNDRLVELALRHNLKVLGLIGRTPEWISVDNRPTSPPKDMKKWEKFVKALVHRYKGKVQYWEIRNEPDIKKFWTGTPEEYVNLLKEAYKVIKETAPEMKVLSAGLDGKAEKGDVYLDKLLKLGMASYCDIIAFHPYGKTPEKSLERVKTFLSIMERYGVKKPLWVTEVGWAGDLRSKGYRAKDEETKALYLKEAFELLIPYAEKIFWYNAIEAPRMHGLIEMEKEGGRFVFSLTPAYTAYKDMTQKGKLQ